MSFQLVFPDSYLKRARKFIRKHPELIKQYEKTLLLLELNVSAQRTHLSNG